MSGKKNITSDIKDFWQKNPCGSDFIEKSDWKIFFREYDEFKYKIEPHIIDNLDSIDWKNKRVLEIGLGQGAEAQRIIERGAIYYGIDLTEESVFRVKKRFEINNLGYESVSVMNAEKIGYEDGFFDIVFSHGVIHHSPDIGIIIGEIFRVLKKNGTAIIMLYHKNSVNYRISINIIRRAGIFLLYIPGFSKIISKLTGEPVERLKKHKENIKKSGLSYLKMSNFIHKSTDGPDNIFSSVFTKNDSKKMFEEFSDIRFSVHYINLRHVPFLLILPKKIKKILESKYGWHLWIYAIK
ncbi:MAG: class I SAM-dependent methyltransferase [Ignavibacteriae bacterium]|nr:class I SAM-dependent methyltransferase [Ignavibacteriota bacterium]